MLAHMRSAKTTEPSSCASVTASLYRLHHIVYVALGRTQTRTKLNLSGPLWEKDFNLSQCMMCVHVYICAGVQREQSRQANRQAHRVPVRSGARWSVSGNDT